MKQYNDVNDYMRQKILKWKVETDLISGKLKAVPPPTAPPPPPILIPNVRTCTIFLSSQYDFATRECRLDAFMAIVNVIGLDFSWIRISHMLVETE